MTRRLALMARVESGGRLPAEYQEVEYLESTGTQFIDLGVYANQDSIMVCDVKLVRNNTQFYYGGGNGYADNTFECYYWNPNVQFNTSNLYIYLNIPDIPNNEKIRIYHSYNEFKLIYNDGEIARTTEWTAPFQTDYTICLFALHRQAGMLCGTPIIYGAKYYQGARLTRDCIPCYRKSDSKPGMYDLVSGTFFTNAGTGEFTVGADVN